jgi:1-pyrroline-5-carboxylate dehydrogenase
MSTSPGRVTYATLSAGHSDDFKRQFDAALAEVRSAFGRSHSHRIGGESLLGDRHFEDRTPADTRVLIGTFPVGSAADVDRAVDAARTAGPGWAGRPWSQRLSILRKAADLLEMRGFELSALVSLEVGKSRLEAMGDVTETADLIRYYCDQIERNGAFEKAMARLNPGEETRSVLRPYGVFGVISPFNFPAALAGGPTAAALACGNTVVLKPSQEAPLSGDALVRAFEEAGVPPGALNLLQGPAETGQALAGHTGLDGIVFTGSKAIGMEILRHFARGTFPKPCIIEMGGKNPAIVLPSADLDEAAEGVARSAFGLQGQKCSACSRVYVHAEVEARFTELLLAKTTALSIGDPSRDGIDFGPVIHARAFETYLARVAEARRDGTILAGAKALQDGEQAHGFFVAPTVVRGLPKDHALLRDELFLPIVCLAPVASLDEALRAANHTEYGLTAGLFSRDTREIQTFLERIEAGVVYVNRRAGATTGAWPGVQPFGGWKGSGSTGKAAGGLHYVQQFMREQSQTLIR